MEENWVIVWFAGAHGWTNGDTPWAVFLQHRPGAMALDKAGLHFEFDGPAGDIVLLPLYGSYIAPPQGSHSKTEFTGKIVKTWEWAKVLPREPLMHVRYWASALREVPVACEETFSVDRSTDSVTIRQKMAWHTIDDQWRTKHLKVNPVNPQLALASRNEVFPVKFSRVVMDLVMPTPFGPYMVAEGEKPLDATFFVLQHVNELGSSATNIPGVNADQGTWARWGAGQTEQYAAVARDAYQAGNVDQYNYACYLFARAFTKLWFARRAPDYFAKYELPVEAPKTHASETNAVKRERLIPSGEPSPFVAGMEREPGGLNAQLVSEVRAVDGEWPTVWLRRSETEQWPMGQVRVGTNAAPRKAQRAWHSRNTERIVLVN